MSLIKDYGVRLPHAWTLDVLRVQSRLTCAKMVVSYKEPLKIL